MKYKIGELEVEAIQWNGRNEKELIDICKRIKNTNDFNYGDYLLTSETSSFIVSEEDFNKIATKVKDPKFKVGDVVYYICQYGCENFDCDKVTIKSAHLYLDHYTYKLTNDKFSRAHESNLFTLEEAIEKLKEL